MGIFQSLFFLFWLQFSTMSVETNPVDYDIKLALEKPRFCSLYMEHKRANSENSSLITMDVRQGLYYRKYENGYKIRGVVDWNAKRNIMIAETKLRYTSVSKRNLEILSADLFATMTPTLTKYRSTSWKVGVSQWWENGIPKTYVAIGSDTYYNLNVILLPARIEFGGTTYTCDFVEYHKEFYGSATFFLSNLIGIRGSYKLKDFYEPIIQSDLMFIINLG